METPAHVAHTPRFTPPLLRTFVLVSSVAAALIALTLLTASPGDTPSASAQTDPVVLVDYDIDDDGYIDIRTNAQWNAIDEDLDTDGIPDSGGGRRSPAAWRAAFPNAMPSAGCPERDHDSDPDTPDVPRCVGYELFNDIQFPRRVVPTSQALLSYIPIGWDFQSWGTGPGVSGHIKGNGYRIITPSTSHNGYWGLVGRLHSGGSITGLGVWDAFFSPRDLTGGFANRLEGGASVVGSYTYSGGNGRYLYQNVAGGLVGTVIDGTISNSFVRGSIFHPATNNTGGLAGRFEPNGRCLNSYASHPGTPQNAAQGGALVGQMWNGGGTFTNCFADLTTHSGGRVWIGSNAGQNAQYGRTYAQMTAPTDYTGPYANWNTDIDGDGEPDDPWYFGDETQLPVLQAFGHDITFPRSRQTNEGTTVNLCTRTLAVANEIIRHLKDDQWREIAPPNEITEVPADIAALTPCTSGADTREVTITQLRNFVVTSEDNPFNLNPDRTSPPSERLTAIHGNDLAYLFSAHHFDLSDNAITTLPTRMFQSLSIRQLDLSGNAITSLHGGTFDGRWGIGADTAAAVGSFIDLSDNRLTDAGIPDRLFDQMAYMRGISLRSNALSGINTRWFERLGNLGRTDPMDTTFRPNLGLQLGGNSITEHYYWQRAFDDYKHDRVQFSGQTAADDLRAAIIAQMTEAGTDTMNVDLMSTSHFANGALGSGPCPSGLTYGPPGSVDFDGNPVQCQTAARWSPPWAEGESTQVQSVAATSGPVSITVSFEHTPDPALTAYQFRYRDHANNPTAPWTQQWRTLPIDRSTAGTRSFTLDMLERGKVYQFQLRTVSNGAPGPPHLFTQGTSAQLPTVNNIQPVIREISVPAGQEVRLEVDIYGRQDDLRNSLSDASDGTVVFQWTESPSGGGAFASPSTARRVTYTAPDLPGTYTVLAEAQPDGVCASHHRSRTEITADDRAPCIATFTVRVSRAPASAAIPADPVNPAGLIPTSLTDSAGVAYAVFTPVDGGTFTGEGITVSAPEGAVPDQQLIGVSATRSTIPVPPPIPGARMTVAGRYYTVNGIQRTGDAPVSGYSLDDPIQACMPLPDMFRADISDVVVVNRNPTDGSLAILTSSVQQTPAGLVACGAIGQLPATVAVANIGVIELPPEPPAPTDEDLPETGATAPSTTTITWTLAVAAAIMAAVATGAVTMATRRRRRSRNDTPAV